MELSAIKKEKQLRVDNLLKDCRVFFAFSTEQFNEGKTPLEIGEKYISIGAGGYMPNSKIKQFEEGFESIKKWYKSAIKENKLRKQNIAYELNNHEAYYTNDITDTVSALGEDYTEAEVLEVFRTERKKQAA